MLILEGDGKRRTREWDEWRALNHHLAGLVAFAHHDPEHLPKFEPTETRAKAKSDPATDLAKLRGYLKGLSMRGKRKG